MKSGKMTSMHIKHWLVCSVLILAITGGLWYWIHRESPKKPATSQVIICDISKVPVSPWGSIREQNDIMVSICQLVNLGYLSTYKPGSPNFTLSHGSLKVQLTLGQRVAHSNGLSFAALY